MTIKEKKLETLVAVNIVCAVLFLSFKWKAAITVGLLISLFSLLSPLILQVVYKVWDTFFSFLSMINTRILLCIVFYIFLTPVSFLKKLITRQKQQVPEDNFHVRDHVYVPDDLKRMG